MMGFFRRNLGLKVASLVLAYIIWAWVASRSDAVKWLRIPVDIEVPSETVVLDYEPHEVRLRLGGDVAAVRRVRDEEVFVRVAVPAPARKVRRTVVLSRRDIYGLPQGVTAELVDKQISVAVEHSLARGVPIALRLKGAPPSGLRIESSRVEPPEVMVTGPESVVRGLASILTTELEMKSRRRSFTVDVDVIPPDPHVTLTPPRVRATVTIADAAPVVELTVPVVPSTPGWVATPASVRVFVEADRELIPRLRTALTAVAEARAVPREGGPAPIGLTYGKLSAEELGALRVTGIVPAQVELRPRAEAPKN